MLSMMGTTYLLTRGRLRRIASLRAGRPLFYELHAPIYKRPQFIQPAVRYQRERNRSDPVVVTARASRQRSQRRHRDDENHGDEQAPGTVQGFVFPWQRRQPSLVDAAETAGADTGIGTLPVTGDKNIPPVTGSENTPPAADALPESPMRAEPRLTLTKSDQE